MNIGYPQATRAGKELARPAPHGLTLPQRTDAPWCAFCGMTTGHWTGCPTDASSHTRSVASATMAVQERTPPAVLGGPANGVLEHLEVPYE